MTMKKRVLIGSPVHQKPEILSEFLRSLKTLKVDTLEVDYAFVDDNANEESSRMLQEFYHRNSKVMIDNGIKQDEYAFHQWTDYLMEKVAVFKNRIIVLAIEENYDYLFFVDSDLVLHPATLQHLVSLEKDIVSEIFWTSWQEGERKFPQVWLSDQYTLYHRSPHETLSDEDVQARTMEFLQQLRKPGVYEVGGLGACTLISRRALLAGVNFNTIPNISLIGEDRHFCVRAAALGFSLFVDTHYPAYHIYRDSDLAGVEMYKYRNMVKTSTNKVTLSMVIKNEADRYLRRVLEECRHYIDEAVIIDDGSTDESVEICKKVLADIPLHIVRNETSRFVNEIELRKQQWEETIKTLPDWILNLDADEVFEKKLREVMPMIVNQHEYDVICFPLYDMWDEDHYHDDEYWCAHKTYRPFLVRYQPDFVYKWKETAQHCGRFPENILELSTGRLDIRLKHYGWASPEDRQKKYERYMQLDPEARYGWKEQYESILDPAPTLRKWEE